MTERTVTVQTEQEETITLCDHCGLSDDAGEIKEYVPRDAEGMQYGTLDLHKHCLDEFGVEVPDGPTYAEISSEASVIDAPAILAFNSIAITFASVSFILALGASYAISENAIVAFLFAVVSFLSGSVAIMGARSDALDTIEELQ